MIVKSRYQLMIEYILKWMQDMFMYGTLIQVRYGSGETTINHVWKSEELRLQYEELGKSLSYYTLKELEHENNNRGQLWTSGSSSNPSDSGQHPQEGR